jgi:predicted DNA-binding transcriptional regulator AlpA
LTVLPKLVRADVIAARTPWTRKHIYDLAKRRQIPHYRFPDGSIAFDPIRVGQWFADHEIAA